MQIVYYVKSNKSGYIAGVFLDKKLAHDVAERLKVYHVEERIIEETALAKIMCIDPSKNTIREIKLYRSTIEMLIQDNMESIDIYPKASPMYCYYVGKIESLRQILSLFNEE